MRLRGGLTRAEVTVITERRVHKRDEDPTEDRDRRPSPESRKVWTLKEGRGSGGGRKRESLCQRCFSSAHPRRSPSTRKLEVMSG